MNTRRMTIPALAFTLLCGACGQGADNGNTQKIGGIDVSEAISKAEGRREADPAASGGNTCLLGYQEKYDQLLTKTLVLEATGFDESKLEVKYAKVMKPEHHSVNYTFDNQRVREKNGYKLPFKDNVQLGGIKAMSLAQFRDSYRAVTKEEDEALDRVLEDMEEGKVSEPEAKQAMENLKKAGVNKEASKKATGTLRDAFKKVAEGYRAVEGIGDAAVWNVETNELIVLDNGVKFELQVDVKDSMEGNRDAAIALAGKMLSVCQ